MEVDDRGIPDDDDDRYWCWQSLIAALGFELWASVLMIDVL